MVKQRRALPQYTCNRCNDGTDLIGDDRMKGARTGIIAGFLLLIGFYVGMNLSALHRGAFEWGSMLPLLTTLPILAIALTMPSKGGKCCKRVPVTVDSQDRV